MSAHVVVDALEVGVPATLSKVALQEVLREKLGYQGLIISDDMEMKAITQHLKPEQAAVMAINAGIDHFLICHSEEVVDAYLGAIEGGLSRGQVDEGRYDSACERVAQFTARWARPPEEPNFKLLASEKSRKIIGAIISGHVDAGQPGGERDPTESWRRQD